MSVGKRSALVTAEELRTIFLTDPEAFTDECAKIIALSTDEVTKQFWQDVKEFAEREREK